MPRILVGNKCDCNEFYAVNTNIAQRLADKFNMPVSISVKPKFVRTCSHCAKCIYLFPAVRDIGTPGH